MTEQPDRSSTSRSSSPNNEPVAPPSPSTPSREGMSGPGPAQPQPIPSPAPGTPRTPGGNQLDAIDEADADKVVPKDPKETQLRDTISPPGAGSHSVDDDGSPPKPL
ncbi:hypothetical protein C8K18_11185 [Paraburkholderia sp. GV068]|jgi:hypothetical protein|uniref:Uncharacterized protein n=2 Tax=Paraburkholderia graminis TaxID=60548 RepID=B1FT65_PARG4|nr:MULTISPECIES: hypothetical protein [Paraburkholderia]EDT13158.1 conserved hypothetical protein [Paraburkholderia graminis C4D1M]MDR6206579.1 hypothetical protein [Paraburkholderia graminis]PTQ95267.1 hypothetical protein C8K19_11285 [Paraburkholderia sp. GV072]PUB01921.1 hypothetical protein C8K18_11185 [Paraburkholderia sp. GV068]CAB3719239.1 hypothetical protein R8871_04707 [Paraburkholderia graminis C4D1M]